jgi:hypothetical protein
MSATKQSDVFDAMTWDELLHFARRMAQFVGKSNIPRLSEVLYLRFDNKSAVSLRHDGETHGLLEKFDRVAYNRLVDQFNEETDRGKKQLIARQMQKAIEPRNRWIEHIKKSQKLWAESERLFAAYQTQKAKEDEERQ